MEPTLALTRDKIRAEVGLFLGWGRGAAFSETTWTSVQEAQVNSCVDSGLRRFYYTASMDGVPAGYEWSFLRPQVTFTLPSGEQFIEMPPDFGGLVDSLTLAGSHSKSFKRIQVTNRVRERYAVLPTTTGQPCEVEIVWRKGTTALEGQRARLWFWPLSDAAYTVNGQYYVHPDALDAAFPYALGGPAHVETILESCLAIAEERLDDIKGGPHGMAFAERMRASIALDRRHKAQTVGYNGDASDGHHLRGRYHRDTSVTFDGTQY